MRTGASAMTEPHDELDAVRFYGQFTHELVGAKARGDAFAARLHLDW